MTVPVSTSRSSYVGNGVTTAFSTGFYFLAASEVVVRLTPSGGVEVVQVLGVHYTVTMPASVGANGSITMLTAPPASSALIVERTVPYVQDTSFRTQGSFSPAVHEDAMDELEFQLQQLARRTSDLESAGAPGSVIAGNGLAFAGSTLHVGAGAGIQSNADTIEVVWGADAAVTTLNTGGSVHNGGIAQAARVDHRHGIATDIALPLSVGGASGAGASAYLSQSDHMHGVPTGVPSAVTAAVNAEGASTAFARLDHHHQVSTGVAVPLTDATNAAGAADTLARSDHQHAHGDRSGGTLHAAATTTVNGFMSAADKAKLDGLLSELVSEGVLKTTNATPQTVLEWTPDVATAENVDLRVVGVKTGGVDAGGFHIRLTVRRFDGVTSIIGQARITADQKTTVGWDVTVSAASPKILVAVTGTADIINWKAQARRTIIVEY